MPNREIIMSKCNFLKGGYADPESMCKALIESIQWGRQTKKSRGLYSGSIVNIKSNERLGEQIKLKSGEFTQDGICLNFCPFCGGQIRDTSED